jgi:DNA-binding HxlR family transcriptional regulator
MAREAPVLDILELLGRRWSLRLVWELRRDAIGFAELRRRTGISSSVLARRLRELSAAAVIEPTGGRRYRLSPAGRELARVLYDLNRWAESAARGRDEVILEQ